jgi:type IX secretion system PorP/SprF family membrane protein
MSLEGSESTASQEYESSLPRTLYFMGGSNIELKNTLFELQPSVFFKTDLQYWAAEATARFRFKKFLSAGVSYRWNDAVALIFGAEIKGVTLGYSYDFPVSNIIKGTSGSHELWIGYNLKLNLNDKNKNKHKSIRLM